MSRKRQTDSLREWDAKTWAEIQSIWRGLVPSEPDARPSFGQQLLNNQEKGWVFERWLTEAFRLSGASGYHRFENPMKESERTKEEIDGLIIDGWQGFLVESKFQAKPVDIDPIMRLHAMADQRPVGTLGLFFSVSGYTDAALDLVEWLRPIRVLLFDGIDLEWVVQARTRRSMMEMVRRKWILALRTGVPFGRVDECPVPFGKDLTHG
jgi:hypothetical protein